jgi:hypothetical protein
MFTMLKIYNISYKYNKMDIMASMMFAYSWLDCIDMPLLAMCLVTCTQASNVRLF